MIRSLCRWTLLLVHIVSVRTFRAAPGTLALKRGLRTSQRCLVPRYGQGLPYMVPKMALDDSEDHGHGSLPVKHSPAFSRRAALVGAAAFLLGAKAPSRTAVAETAVLDAPSTAPPALTGVTTPPAPKCNTAISHLVAADGAELFLIGTAHISKDSAILVRDVIRAVKPDAVMVELDESRVRSVKAATAAADPAVGAAADGAAPPPPPPPPKTVWELVQREAARPGAGVGQKVRNIEAGLIGMAISTLYTKLNTMGFSSGEELATGIREGRAAGARIILGDRPVAQTLSRLQESIDASGWRAVAQFAQEIIHLGSNSASPETEAIAQRMLVAEEGMRNGQDTAGDKDAIAVTVEALKERGTIRDIMANLKESLPEVHAAMISERDAYMCNSILSAGARRMVAVVGMAHLDGIEARVAEAGFVPSDVCPI